MPNNILPLPQSSIELSEGEIVVRQYHITNLKRRKARGDVAVTNKRIIYQGKGKTSTRVDELPLETVSAITTYYGSGFRIGYIILGIGCVFSAISTLFTVILPILFIALAIYFFIKCYNTGYSLRISSSGVTGTGISVGASDMAIASVNSSIFRRLFATTGQGAAISINAEPTEQAVQMMHELGAIVMDLKIMGDRAITKWQRFQSAPVDPSALNSKLSSAINVPNMPNINISLGQQKQAPQQVPPQQYAPQPTAPQQAPPQVPQAPQPQRTAPPPPPGRTPPPPPPAQGGGNADGGFFG